MNVYCRIELLGGLSLERAGDRITRFQTQKTAALLAFLAYHAGQSVPRETLLELLWPEADPVAGRNRLSTALSTLRRHVEPPGIPAGALIVANHAEVRMRSDLLTTDVAEFEALLQAAAQARGRTERTLFLVDALARYRGPLLPGYYDEWALAARQRLADLRFDAGRRLIEALQQTGESERALQTARDSVQLDPLREEAHCDLIRLLYERGEHAAARRQYDELIRHLQQDLGLQPAAETRRLAERLALRSPTTLPGPLTLEPGMKHAAHPTPPTLGRPSGTVTALLTDIEGSTALWERAGEAFREVLQWHHALLRAQFDRFSGYEVTEAGDSFLVIFAGAAEALSCAIACQRALAVETDGDGKARIRVRMALHSGDIAPDNDGYHGLMLHHASRILAAAHGDQILCSETTAALLKRSHGVESRLLDLGLYRLRDMPQPERLFMVDYPDRAERTFPPLRATPSQSPALPPRTTRFFGREIEMARLQAILSGIQADDRFAIGSPSPEPQHRLITLTGTGGTGKTRLAVETAQVVQSAFSGAVWFVPLADTHDAGRVVAGIAEALRLPPRATGEPIDPIVDRLSQQPSLLILDNFEHLVEEGAAIVGRLLERVPTLICLVTSRRLLGLAGEQEFILGPLPTPETALGGNSDATREPPAAHGQLPNAQRPTPTTLLSVPSIALFVDRAQMARPDFQLTARNAPAVVALVERLEGIPLALELAAGRAQVLTPEGMLTHLEHDFSLLASRKRDANERHRTLHAAIEWSYRLLTPELQRLFARLSVFRGGWTAESGERVCSEAEGAAISSSPSFVSFASSSFLTALQELIDPSSKCRIIEA
jgi:predicted ATPase/DNA-binding SARP family transcriptional activator